MRILITADTVGGVWIYTRELVAGLVQQGHSVVLVSFGGLPRADQLDWLRSLPSNSFDYRPTDFPLEWMQESAAGIAASFRFLQNLVSETKPDILHSSQFCYGALNCGIPKVVVAHSDVLTWWDAVHRTDPPDTPWSHWYTETVSRGLTEAHVVVAPSRWMLNAAKQQYAFATPSRVIYNGRSAGLFNPSAKKHNRAITVGRMWDQAKQVRLLLSRPQAVPVQIVGPKQPPDGTQTVDPEFHSHPGVKLLDTQSEADLCMLLSRASIYVATSRYEPFGLAPVEAALSRCALVMNDIPTFRELWEDCALFFDCNDADVLAKVIDEAITNSELRHSYAERAYRRARAQFNSQRMIEDYESLYHELASKSAAA
jgi:glycogen synthase